MPVAKNSKKNNTVNAVIRQRFNSLGPMTWEQVSIGCFFLAAVILWITRDLIVTPGWESLFREK
jgi:sodium/sulfate cotransporter 1/4